MKRVFSSLALAGVLALGACAITSNSIESDAQALLSAAEANGSISAANGVIVSDIITGYEDVSAEAAASISSGDNKTVTALKALDVAIGNLATDDTSTTVSDDATQAQTLLADILSGGTTVTQAQIEKAVATFLIDYLAAHSSSGAAAGALSTTEQLILDAHAKIAAIH